MPRAVPLVNRQEDSPVNFVIWLCEGGRMECAIESKVYKVYGKNTTLEGHAEEGIHGFHDFSNGWHCYMTSLGTSSYPGYQKVRAKNTT